MTYEDINNDLSFISENILDGKQTVPSAAKIWSYSFCVPVCCLALNFLSVMGYSVYAGTLTTVDSFASIMMSYFKTIGAATIFIGIFFSLLTYPKALIYLSISEALRRNSLIISALRRKVKLLFQLLLLINLIAAISGIYMPSFIFVAPVSLVLFIFIATITISTEIARYGLAPLISKLSSAVKKIA
ncbi:MAG: hypothetical protein E7I22_05000 [Bifidobacterium longum]|nr:hypothetical protein [Bifidobacterium longum]